MKVRLSWFSVNDFEGAKKFYGNVLGLKKTFEAPQWAEFAGAEGEETIGIAVKTDSLVGAHLNNFDNQGIGVDNLAAGLVDARLNWWGCSRGPTAAGCAEVSGANVLFVPFLTSPF